MMVSKRLVLMLRSKDNASPSILTSFNSEKDTLYLNQGIQSVVDGMSLDSLLNAVPDDQIKEVQNFAIDFCPNPNPQFSAQKFITDLGHFHALRTLRIVHQGCPSFDLVAQVLDVVSSEPKIEHYLPMFEEDLSGGIGKPLADWLNVIRPYANGRNLAVEIVTWPNT